MAEEARLPLLKHNAARSSHFVFGREGSAAGGGDTVELKDMGASRLSKRFGRGPVGGETADDADADDSYVLHVVEAHHSLQGIALKYRVPLAQLKQWNNLHTESELHARKTIKIPAPKNGLLYSTVHGDEKDSGVVTKEESTRTHTTANLVPADHDSSAAASAAGGLDEETPAEAANPEALLSRLDRDLEAAKEVQHRLLTAEPAEDGIDPRYLVAVEQPAPWFFVRDWRHIAVAAGVLLIAFPLVMGLSDITKIEQD